MNLEKKGTRWRIHHIPIPYFIKQIRSHNGSLNSRTQEFYYWLQEQMVFHDEVIWSDNFFGEEIIIHAAYTYESVWASVSGWVWAETERKMNVHLYQKRSSFSTLLKSLILSICPPHTQHKIFKKFGVCSLKNFTWSPQLFFMKVYRARIEWVDIETFTFIFISFYIVLGKDFLENHCF